MASLVFLFRSTFGCLANSPAKSEATFAPGSRPLTCYLVVLSSRRPARLIINLLTDNYEALPHYGVMKAFPV